jgi:hypothetical protein
MPRCTFETPFEIAKGKYLSMRCIATKSDFENITVRLSMLSKKSRQSDIKRSALPSFKSYTIINPMMPTDFSARSLILLAHSPR